jgi:hypothetical protein
LVAIVRVEESRELRKELEIPYIWPLFGFRKDFGKSKKEI